MIRIFKRSDGLWGLSVCLPDGECLVVAPKPVKVEGDCRALAALLFETLGNARVVH